MTKAKKKGRPAAPARRVATPPAATVDTGTPGTVARILDASAGASPAPASAPAPVPVPVAPKIPGDTITPDAPSAPPRKRGRPAGTSMDPEAIRARQRRREKRERAGRTLTADALTPAGLKQLRSGAALTGPITSPVRLPPSPEKIAAATSSLSGLIKALGIGCALFLGEHWKVPDSDALGTAGLMLDAWPQLAEEMGDMTKVLAVTAVGSLVLERVNKTAATRKRGSSLAPDAPPAFGADKNTRPGEVIDPYLGESQEANARWNGATAPQPVRDDAARPAVGWSA